MGKMIKHRGTAEMLAREGGSCEIFPQQAKAIFECCARITGEVFWWVAYDVLDLAYVDHDREIERHEMVWSQAGGKCKKIGVLADVPLEKW